MVLGGWLWVVWVGLGWLCRWVVFVLVVMLELKRCGVCGMMRMGMAQGRRETASIYTTKSPNYVTAPHWAAPAASSRCATFPSLSRAIISCGSPSGPVTSLIAPRQGHTIGSWRFRRHRGLMWLEVMRPMSEDGPCRSQAGMSSRVEEKLLRQGWFGSSEDAAAPRPRHHGHPPSTGG